MEFFTKNPKRNIKHPEIVDWVTEELKKRTGEVFRDPDRQIRQLSQKGLLQKISKGIYRYDPDFVVQRELEDFTPAQKAEILNRDGYRCVVCGKRIADGVELQVDHIKAKNIGDTETQDFCAQILEVFEKNNINGHIEWKR